MLSLYTPSRHKVVVQVHLLSLTSALDGRDFPQLQSFKNYYHQPPITYLCV